MKNRLNIFTTKSNSENCTIDDSRADDDHVTNSKCAKFLQQKAAINAIFRIQFHFSEKCGDFKAVQGFILATSIKTLGQCELRTLPLKWFKIG